MSEYKPTRKMDTSGSSDSYSPGSYAPPDDFGAGRRMPKTEIIDPSAAAGLFAWLVIIEGAHAGQVFQLRGETTIGRDGASCEVVLDDSSVSTQHARIKLEQPADKNLPKEFVLYDLAAANKTFVNGEEILKHLLADNDRIKVGRTTLVFKKV